MEPADGLRLLISAITLMPSSRSAAGKSLATRVMCSALSGRALRSRLIRSCVDVRIVSSSDTSRLRAQTLQYPQRPAAVDRLGGDECTFAKAARSAGDDEGGGAVQQHDVAVCAALAV